MSDPGESRVFVREMISQTYGLDEFRRRQLAAPRVRSPKDDVSIKGKKGYTEGQDAWWRVGPADDPFWTQTLQVHLVELPARGAAKGHGHQNEAPFYILEGAGYEIHDDVRYDWTKGDLVLVHTDSVHQHFNPYDEPALTLVIKAKATWLFAGLVQQGSRKEFDDDRYGEREDWSRIWTPGVTAPEEGRGQGRRRMGDHAARQGARAVRARAARRPPVQRRRLRARHPCREPFGQALEDGRRDHLRRRG